MSSTGISKMSVTVRANIRSGKAASHHQHKATESGVCM
jgi:Na+/H+-translocating membrane pyrophosphatase